MTDASENPPIRPDLVDPAEEPTDEPAAGGDLAGALGGLDFGSLMEQASNLQAQMLTAQQELTETEVEGVAGGGVVRITVTGGFEFRSVVIDPTAVDPTDVDMLQDLVLAALNDATARIADLQSDAMGDGGLDLGGLDLGGLGDLFGS